MPAGRRGAASTQPRAQEVRVALPDCSVSGSASRAPVSAEVVKSSDVSHCVQRILRERTEGMAVDALEAEFTDRFSVSLSSATGISTREYFRRKRGVFAFDEERGMVWLQPRVSSGPPLADPAALKDDAFVLDEFERLIEEFGPVCYVSAMCGKFIQRNGLSVTSITKHRPLDLLRRNPHRFLALGGGNATLVRHMGHPEVRAALQSAGRAPNPARPAQDPEPPIKQVSTEQDVVREFRTLIAQSGNESVYISLLCSRFLQRNHRPVTNVINGRPADFFRKYSDVFELVGGGHVRLAPAALLAESPRMSDAELGPPPGFSPAHGAGDSASSAGSSTPRSLPEPAGALGRLTAEVAQELLRCVDPPGRAEALLSRAADLGALLADRSFLAIREVVITGLVGKGLSTLGTAPQVELVLLVDRMPGEMHKWLPHISETMLAVLEMALGSRAAGFRTFGGPWVELVLLGNPHGGEPEAADLQVKLVVAPSAGPRELIWRQSRADADDRGFVAASLARDAKELVARQPPSVRAAMKLLHWWAAQQAWSSPKSTPPSYFFELLAIWVAHNALLDRSGCAAVAGGPEGSSLSPAALVEAALDVCAEMPDVRILWQGSGVASFEPAAAEAVASQGLPCVVDPVNPSWNVVDPEVFDSAELAARTAARDGPEGRAEVFLAGVGGAAAKCAGGGDRCSRMGAGGA